MCCRVLERLRTLWPTSQHEISGYCPPFDEYFCCYCWMLLETFLLKWVLINWREGRSIKDRACLVQRQISPVTVCPTLFLFKSIRFLVLLHPCHPCSPALPPAPLALAAIGCQTQSNCRREWWWRCRWGEQILVYRASFHFYLKILMLIVELNLAKILIEEENILLAHIWIICNKKLHRESAVEQCIWGPGCDG